MFDPTQTDPLTSFPGAAPPPPAPIAPKSVAGMMIAPRPTESRPAPVVPPPQGNTAQFMQLVRAHESGGNDRASSGVADGRYQFTPQTWAGVTRAHPELGLRPNDIWDGAKQDLAMRAISQDYINTLKVNGIPPTMPNMFMLHFLGVGGGPKFLKQMAANPNADAAAAFPLEAKYNPTIFHEKNGQSRSLAQVYALMTKTFGGPQAPVVDSRTATEPPTPAGMGFSSTAEMTANARLSALPGMKLDDVDPPLLPGMKLDDVDPPLLPGMKLDAPQTGDYIDANGQYHPKVSETKPDDKGYDVVGVDPNTGNPIYADPNKTEEFLKQQGEDVKGLLAGAAQDITGPASLIPPPPGSPAIAGGAAERLNKYLSETGDPTARKIGQTLPMLAPVGEVAGAAKGGMKAFEAGESLVPSMLKGLGFGSATSALSESSNPSGKDTYSEQIAAKAPAMLKGAAGGALAGAAGPVAGIAVQGVAKEIANVFGTKVAKAAEDLRTGFDSETGKVLSEEKRAAKIATIERAAEKKIIADQAARPTAPPEKVGAELQAALDADRKAVMEERKVKSGFAAAVKSDAGQPLIKTRDATNEIAAIEKKYDVNLDDLKTKLATKADVRGGPTTRGVSIERGQDFVETLNKKIEESNSGPAHELMDVRDKFVEHMEQTHPQLETARKKYAALSRDADFYERKGKLAKAAESDLYSKQPIMDPTRVKTLLTDKTEGAGKAIERLIARDPKVQDTLRQSFNHDLFGSGATSKPPAVDQMTKFLERNRSALEHSDLYKEFEKLRDDRAAFEGAADARKTALDAHHEAATIKTELKAARKPTEVVSASRRALNMLVRDKRITQPEYERRLNEVKDVEDHIEDHVKARRFALTMVGILAAAAGGSEAARYIGHKYNPR